MDPRVKEEALLRELSGGIADGGNLEWLEFVTTGEDRAVGGGEAVGTAPHAPATGSGRNDNFKVINGSSGMEGVEAAGVATDNAREAVHSMESMMGSMDAMNAMDPLHSLHPIDEAQLMHQLQMMDDGAFLDAALLGLDPVSLASLASLAGVGASIGEADPFEFPSLDAGQTGHSLLQDQVADPFLLNHFLASDPADESTMQSELDSLLLQLSAVDSNGFSNFDTLGASNQHSAHPFVIEKERDILASEDSKSSVVVAMVPPMVLANSAPSAKRVGGSRKKRISVRESPTSKVEDDDIGAGEVSESEAIVFEPTTNPTVVFTQAAIKASTRRRTVEESISCISCSNSIGMLELRGTPASFEASYSASIKCGACSTTSLLETTSNSRRASMSGVSSANRKRRTAPNSDSPTDQVMSCLVCKRATAQGCVKKRIPVSSPVHKPREVIGADDDDVAAHASTDLPPPTATWTTPDFAVSLICDSCHSRYLFCSECGGGGKTRTGKYRPRALFPVNRRTCSLPHIRIGSTPVSHRVLEAPIADQQDVLEGVRDVFFDCLVSLYAVPGVLEGIDDEAGSVFRSNVDVGVTFGSGSSTSLTYPVSPLSKIYDEVEKLWDSTVRDAIVSDVPHGLGGGKVYVTVAWIEKRNRNKGQISRKKKKEEEDEAAIPWLVRLAMEGTVAPLKAQGPLSLRSPSASSSVSKAIPAKPNAEDKTYVSFAVSEWDRARGALFVLQMAPRSVYVPTKESYGDLLRRNIERVQADSRRDNAPPLEHVWCWTREESHSRLRSIPERLGFLPLEQYVRDNPGVDRQTFVRESYPPLMEPGVSVHVTSVKKFLKSFNN
ncbi:hypothetical protein BC830DRAFT_1098058 [Chytriomyces sp. MP71]|nr:hypothetical protein BC830DRAFT_1098058 [Chytriomyces sp. MP71]